MRDAGAEDPDSDSYKGDEDEDEEQDDRNRDVGRHFCRQVSWLSCCTKEYRLRRILDFLISVVVEWNSDKSRDVIVIPYLRLTLPDQASHFRAVRK